MYLYLPGQNGFFSFRIPEAQEPGNKNYLLFDLAWLLLDKLFCITGNKFSVSFEIAYIAFSSLF